MCYNLLFFLKKVPVILLKIWWNINCLVNTGSVLSNHIIHLNWVWLFSVIRGFPSLKGFFYKVLLYCLNFFNKMINYFYLNVYFYFRMMVIVIGFHVYVSHLIFTTQLLLVLVGTRLLRYGTWPTVALRPTITDTLDTWTQLLSHLMVLCVLLEER